MDHFTIAQVPGLHAGLHPVAAAAIIATGGLVCINAAGNAVPAGSAAGFVGGRAVQGVDNSAGIAGAASVLLERGCYVLNADATNAPTRAHVGRIVFATAPDVVASVGTCRAGILRGFDEVGAPIVDTAFARSGAPFVGASVDGVAGAASTVAALAAATETIGDDVRALITALRNTGILS